jgi:glutathione synthase/RimK-type ligase-like ATP-grasp enzyme
MIHQFSSHEADNAPRRRAVFSFGRMNPPTTGHGVVIQTVKEEAMRSNADHFVFVSKTHDAKKNPIRLEAKLEYLRTLFPSTNISTEANNPWDAVLHLCEMGYTDIVLVTGDDRHGDYQRIADYKGRKAEKDPKGRSYTFESFEVRVAGDARTDDGEGLASVRGGKARSAAFNGDFAGFARLIPTDDGMLKERIYNDVRKGLGLTEQYIAEAREGKDEVTILALTSSEKDLSDSVEKMQAICKKRGIPFHAVKTSKAQVDLSNVVSKKIVIKNYDGEGKDISIVPSDTVAIVRGGVMNSEVGVAILTILQNNGVFMVNERGGMELCANKLETAIALKKHGLPHPRTAYVSAEANIESAVKEIGGKFPVICKTLTGAEGIGVSKIESMESLKSVLQTLWKFGAEVILQEFLPDFKNDVRSIVLNGKIFACAKRDKAPKDFRTNIARGSKGGSFQLSDEEIKLVEQAARVSKCYYVGIDHVINDGKPYIIEMNASPGSGNIYYRYYEDGKGKDNVKGEELIGDFLDHILVKANWKLFSNLAVRETVKIDGVEYQAKIDTGNSGYNMIHATDIKDNGDHTVTFTLANGKKVTKKIVSRIRVKSGVGEKKRIVVLMDIDFHGKHFPNIKFSVGDRSHMSTKVLLGLRFLGQTGMMVDPAEAIYPQPDPAKRSKGGEEEEEIEESLDESDATKGKQFKTKTGKVRKSASDKASGLPKKYVSGLTKGEAKKRKAALAARAERSDDDPRAWEFVNPREKNMKTKPSKYTTLFKKLAKKGNLKAVNNSYEHDEALERLDGIDNSEEGNGGKLRLAIAYEERCIGKGMNGAASLARAYIDHLKEQRDEENGTSEPTTIDEDFGFLMLEVSPPSGPARRFSKKEKVKGEFKKRYGKDWKSVFYATAWKMHGKSESVVVADEWLAEADRLHDVMRWTSLAKRGPLEIGTDEIVKTYKRDTPGERERLKEEGGEDGIDDEKRRLYKEWQKLVNMSGKEIQSFLDSDEGGEAGLSRKEAGKAGAGGKKITSGRDSARAIIRMLGTPMAKWTANDWKWAGKQVNFISRMKGAKGGMRDDKGRPTRKLLALKVWGHNPEKKG